MRIFKIIENPEKRLFGFDIIRAFSVILVMHMHFLQHFSNFLGINYFLLPLPDPVDMFFVCSGFLIGFHFLKDIYKTQKVGIKFAFRFLIMRWVRTLPAYYIMLLFLIFLYALPTKQLNIPFRNFFFVQNLYLHYSTFYRETWTIAVEEWFYISFPILFLLFAYLFKLSKQKTYLFVLIFMIIGSIFLKIYYYFNIYTQHNFKEWGSTFREIVLLRLDTIAIGLLAAYVSYFYEKIWNKYKYQSLIIGLVIYFATIFYYWLWSNQYIQNNFSTFYHYVFYYFVSPISITLCLPYLKTITYKNTFIHKITLYTSLISYSIYLLHGSFLLMIAILLYQGKVINNIAIIYFGWLFFTFLLSNFFYNKVEFPFMNKRKWLLQKLGLDI